MHRRGRAGGDWRAGLRACASVGGARAFARAGERRALARLGGPWPFGSHDAPQEGASFFMKVADFRPRSRSVRVLGRVVELVRGGRSDQIRSDRVSTVVLTFGAARSRVAALAGALWRCRALPSGDGSRRACDRSAAGAAEMSVRRSAGARIRVAKASRGSDGAEGMGEGAGIGAGGAMTYHCEKSPLP